MVNIKFDFWLLVDEIVVLVIFIMKGKVRRCDLSMHGTLLDSETVDRSNEMNPIYFVFGKDKSHMMSLQYKM